ncbi:MAG: hypothetical protein LUF80_00545 [Oscillospiraceae bacterium]|nr:hypothetical protein [Oscillospiraceae bacterium]
MDKPNKPLKDWTLSELRDYCCGRECGNDCLLYEGSCMMCVFSPCSWDLDLTDKPKYTADEIALAKLLLKVGGEKVKMTGDEIAGYLVSMHYTSGTTIGYSTLPRETFPSLQPGEWVNLKNIAGSEAQDETD